MKNKIGDFHCRIWAPDSLHIKYENHLSKKETQNTINWQKADSLKALAKTQISNNYLTNSKSYK